MRDKDKNRDPEKARKRAVADARCALRKLELLADLEALAKPGALKDHQLADPTGVFVWNLLVELGMAPEEQS